MIIKTHSINFHTEKLGNVTEETNSDDLRCLFSPKW